MQVAQQFRGGIEGLQYILDLLGLGVGFVCNFDIKIGLRAQFLRFTGGSANPGLNLLHNPRCEYLYFLTSSLLRFH